MKYEISFKKSYTEENMHTFEKKVRKSWELRSLSLVLLSFISDRIRRLTIECDLK